MRIKLISKDETIEVKEPTEKHQIEYIGMLDAKEKGKMSPESIIHFQDKQIAELTGKPLEEVKNMPLVDKNKIMEAITSRYVYLGKCEYKMDF